MAKRRKNRTHLRGQALATHQETTGKGKSPKSFVVRSGIVGGSVNQLVRDVRKVLEPNTASRLKERNTNRLRDYISMSGPLGVSHILLFSQTLNHGSTPIPTPTTSSTTSSKSNPKKKQKQKQPQPPAEPNPDPISSSSNGNISLRLARLPHGPTISFRILRYALMSDVLRSSKRPRSPGREFGEEPLLILNNFGAGAEGAGKEMELMSTMFKNLFPQIRVQSMHLTEARRIVLLSFNPTTRTIDFRHYLISVKPVGISRNIRKIVHGTLIKKEQQRSRSQTPSGGGVGKKIPDLGKMGDISDWVLRKSGLGGVGSEGGFDSESEMSESEYEDGRSASENEVSSGAEEEEVGVGGTRRKVKRETTVELPQDYVGRGNRKSEKRAIKLTELGPRMELGLIKIEEGIGAGEVLFHEYVQKTKKEVAALKAQQAERRALIAQRRAEQDANVKRKKEERDSKKRRGKKGADDGDDGDEEEDEGEEEVVDEMDEDLEQEMYGGLLPDVGLTGGSAAKGSNGGMEEEEEEDEEEEEGFEEDEGMDMEGEIGGDEISEDEANEAGDWSEDEDEDEEEEEMPPPRPTKRGRRG